MYNLGLSEGAAILLRRPDHGSAGFFKSVALLYHLFFGSLCSALRAYFEWFVLLLTENKFWLFCSKKSRAKQTLPISGPDRGFLVN